ncbi:MULTISPECIES: sugar phosphate isomerase/epimerase [Desulfitobacterium]|uniref:Sugar phosphate isomerase/epimerase n=1 Tax=Desulfitobacterium dehalogenans (strain ATCC 51507 / DSM 9161 / JW/IU-DC1) TaxID=756499 RepID=I4ACJ7_DESDJ|nr:MULTISPECIES: sugar phosphate isomerase/epimerase family protein [Desulfitobacterium]AFM01682.1 sugar phosphate isomerase/epimerase [Desulfitobacterium dehalogenans ATCC 51507]
MKVLDQKIGIFSWFGFVLPFEERIALIQETGFTGTSLWWEDEEEPFPMPKERMPALVRERGLILENIHVPWCDANALWSDDKALRRAIITKHKQWLEDCARFEIPLLVMHLCDGENPPEPNEYGLESMGELAKAAEEQGVRIAVENTRRRDSVEYVLRHISSRALGFCFDSSHHRLTDQEDFHLLRSFGDRLLTTHLSDNDGLKDRHWLPGHGVIDWVKVAGAFPRGYKDFLTLEVYPTPWEVQETPEEFLVRAYERIAGVRTLLEKNSKPIMSGPVALLDI